MKLRPLLAVLLAVPFTATAVDMAVVFNEIHYHPAGTNTEWVELHNLHGVDVDLSGWEIDGGVNYTFAEGAVIRGHGFLLVAEATAGLPGALGPWTGSLNNAGETIRLRNRDNRIMAEVDFSDNGDWPVAPDGTGPTLSRRRPGAHDGPAAWTSSNQIGGTPGAANFGYPGAPARVTTPVPIGATGWKYLSPGAVAPAGWETSGFSDAGWIGGQSVFYAGPAQIAEPTQEQVILSDPGVGLQGWWAFEDNLSNSVAGGTNGTAVGADFAYVADPAYAGKTGKALRINVITASNANTPTTHIACGNLPVLNGTNNFTWAAWVRSREGGTNNIILGNRYNATGAEFAPREFIKLTNIQFEWHYTGIGENNDYSPDLTGTAAAPSAWTHFASVKTGSTLTLYRNGVQVASRQVNGFPVNAQPFFIGGNRSGAGTTEGWPGLIDDMALWTKALPAQAITGLFNGTYTPATAPTTVTVIPPTVPPPPAGVVWPVSTVDVMVDTFDGPTIHGNWTEVDQGLESTGPAGYTAAISGGQLTLSGTATAQYWYGKSLRSDVRFNARKRHDVSVERVLLTRGGPATNVVRSSLWLWADAGHYVHFSHNWGETGWSYNSNDTGGSGTLNPTGSGNNLALADADDANGGATVMKLVWIPGTFPGQGTVQMYKGTTLLGSQAVTNWPADFHVMLTGQARAIGDIVSATFDNFVVRESTEEKLQTELFLSGAPWYFRKSFEFAGSPARSSAILWPLIDDGAIVYLNGTEVARINANPDMTATVPVIDAFFPASPVSIPGSALVQGTNVLAVAVLNEQDGTFDTDMMFGVQLTVSEAPSPPQDVAPTLVFNLVRGPANAAANPSSAIVIRNAGSSTSSYTGLEIRNGDTLLYTFPAGSLAAGASVSVPLASLPGYADGMELALVAGGASVLDSRRVDAVSRQRYTGPDGTIEWATLDPHNTAIVINEIFYDGPGASPEQWVELHNKSGASVLLDGWRFSDGIDFNFATGTSLAAGAYLVIAWDVTAFQALHPGVTNVVGPFSGGLAGGGERLRLVDANGNLADEVRYSPGETGSPLGAGGRWPKWAAGGGASLELTDPQSDNNNAAAWSDSAATPGAWQNINYSFSAANIPGDPVQWNEVLFGLLDDGEVLVDDFRLIDTATLVDLVPVGSFEASTIGQPPASWRLIGTHRHSVVAADPDNAGQKVLHVKATGAYEHMHNHCSITLKNGAALVAIDPAKTYQITCRAKWLRGSNQFHTRLYFNKGGRTTLLPEAATGGTPGAQNSTYAPNAKPLTFSGGIHSPAVPAAAQPATVTVRIVETTQTVASATLTYTAIDAGAGSGSAPLTLVSGNTWAAQIPAQTAGRKFAFSFTATGSGGANVSAPGGTVQWDDGNARLTLPTGVQPTNLRIIMSNTDQTWLHTNVNVMSNDRLPCTIIENERDIYYNCAVRLKGSERGRNQPVRVGFNLLFPPENLFRGSMGTVTIDRSGAGNQFSQKEMLVKRIITHSGGLPSMEDDLIRLISPQAAQIGPAILTRRYDGDWLADQFGGAQDDGTMFEYELIYYPNSNSPAGNVENPKLPEPDNVVGVGVNGSLGTDKERYRWHWLIKNNREADDYAGLIPVLSAVGQPAGASFNNAVAPLLEVDQWTRSYAAQVLCGIGDNYATGSQHNMLIYVPPAGSGLKAMYFPWDMDFSFNQGSTSSMTPSDVPKFVANPAWKRFYWANVLDICTTSFNATYITPWAAHYTNFVNENLNSFVAYITTRNSYALGQLNAAIPNVTFQITTATGGSPGADFSAPGPVVNLDGDGWVNVDAIRVNGGAPVPVTWTDDNSWRISVPVFFGPNPLLIEGLTNSGTAAGSDTITITGTTGPAPASSTNTALSELMYNPSPGGEEFIELLTFSGNTVDFTGCYFSAGIDYAFPAGTQVPANGRILVVRSQAGFAAAYPGFAGLIAAGEYASTGTALSNGGETLTLIAANGSTIFSTDYSDAIPGTDAGGYSLVRMLASSSSPPATCDWRQSVQTGGSPGGSDAVAFTGVAAADADHDGYPALAEYVFGTSDTDAASRPPPVAWPLNGSVFSLTFARTSGADDAIIEPEFSDDLAAWALPSGWSAVRDAAQITPLAGGREQVTYGPAPHPSTGPREFFRLKIRQR